MPNIQDAFPPLLIKVSEFGWEAVPRTVPPTPRDEFLLNEIYLSGGISLTTPPGLYLFSITPGPAGEVVTLYPYKHVKKVF